MTHAAHPPLLATWLPRVQLDPSRLTHVSALHGGASGSSVYRLEGYAEPFVLKITPASAPDYVRERSQREIAFYQTLAARVPVPTPAVHHSVVDPDGGSALLVRAYGPPLPAADWTDAEYREIARQLARLHARFWRATEELARLPWLRPPSGEITQETIAAARDAWQVLQRQPAFEAVFTAARRRLLDQLLERVAGAPSDTAELPLTLCHNDFHMENLLRADGGQFIWTDWQEVGVGYGADDLSFFCQRAAHAGADVPLELMLAAYRDELETCTGQRVDAQALRARVARHELLTRLLHWPAYLVGAAPAALDAQLGRIEQLAAQL